MNRKELALGAGVVVIGIALYALWKGAKHVLGTSLNPTSDQNLAYQGVNALTQSLSGNSTDTFGTWLYGKINPTAAAGTSSTDLVTDSGGDQYAPNIFVIDANGNMTTPVSLSQASDWVLSGKYQFAKNPALGYYDRIVPVR